MNRIAAHVWADGRCIHCGLAAEQSEKSCVYRDAPPRPMPTSIFADLAEIGARAKEIRAAEETALAGAVADDAAAFDPA